jgi:hypothetical protein
MDDKALQRDILSSYNRLRLGMGIIAFVTPVIIPIWAAWFDVSWQSSLSAYYFAPVGDQHEYSIYPGRVLFVGALYALGSFLILYKGFSRWENILLNVAGASAVGVAMFPMYPQPGYFPSFDGLQLHYKFALLLFACMAGTVIFCYRATLQWVEDPKRRAIYLMAYRMIALLMVLFPLTALGFNEFSGGRRYAYWAEFFGIWTFSIYWFVKSYELSESDGEMKAFMASLPLRSGPDHHGRSNMGSPQ